MSDILITVLWIAVVAAIIIQIYKNVKPPKKGAVG